MIRKIILQFLMRFTRLRLSTLESLEKIAKEFIQRWKIMPPKALYPRKDRKILSTILVVVAIAILIAYMTGHLQKIVGEEGRVGRMSTAIGDHSKQRRRMPVSDSVTVGDVVTATLSMSGGSSLANCCPGVTGQTCPGSNPSYILLHDNLDDISGFSQNCWAGGSWKSGLWTQDTSVKAEGTGSLRLQYNQYSNGPGFEDTSENQWGGTLRTIWITWLERFSSGWDDSDTGQKDIRAYTSGGGDLQVLSGENSNSRPRLNTEGMDNDLTSSPITTTSLSNPGATWYCFEAQFVMNDVGTANGSWAFYVNGTQVSNNTALEFITPPTTQKNFRYAMITTYYNQNGCTENCGGATCRVGVAGECDQPAATQYRWMDSVTYSTQRLSGSERPSICN